MAITLAIFTVQFLRSLGFVGIIHCMFQYAAEKIIVFLFKIFI